MTRLVANAIVKMSIYRIRKKEDFETLDQWVKRGMLGGSAKNMIGNAEALLEGRWTVAEIKVCAFALFIRF